MAGTAVTYTYVVKNTGTATLTNVTVTDPMTGLSAIKCGGGSNVTASLAAAASVTCTATYTTTAADVTAGKVTNTGTVTATPPTGSNLTASSTLTILLSIAIQKSASITSFSAAGTPVTYTYVVKNTDAVTLTNVTVTDNKLAASAINCGNGSNVVASLAGGASVTCTANYTTTAADVAAGGITNTGTVVGTPPSGPNLTGTSSLTIPAVGSAFTCAIPTDYLSQTNTVGNPTTLYGSVIGAGTITYPVINSNSWPYTYNALGFDPLNDYLYATVLGSTGNPNQTGNTLLQIDSTGKAVTLGAITGLTGNNIHRPTAPSTPRGTTG